MAEQPIGDIVKAITADVKELVRDEVQLAKAGAPDNNPRGNGIGLGMAAPTILAQGTHEQIDRLVPPILCRAIARPRPMTTRITPRALAAPMSLARNPVRYMCSGRSRVA